MKPTRLLVACLLPLAVTACGIPDLVAHGVKEFDKTSAKPQSPAPAAQPAAQPAVVHDDPPPTPAPVRESISVEPLR